VRAYEDHLLGRLAADPRFEAACDALARLPQDCRAEGVALLVEQLLAHILFADATAVSPAVARRVLSRPVPELLELGLAQLRQQTGAAASGELLEAMVSGYEQLVHRARHTDVLLTDKDVFTLENLPVLRSSAQRVAIQQMVDAAQALERALPRRLRPRLRRRGGTPTRVEDESAYPTGGFASISNSGSMENIVCSELVYIDDSDEFDLFDVRFAEAELLFYTRDESVFLRNQRTISFLLYPDLVRARFKDAELPWQRLVLVLGLLLCAVRRLSDWLSEEALLFRVVFIDPEGKTSPLGEEQDLCRLLLREWIDKGTVQVTRTAADAALAGSEASYVTITSDPEHEPPWEHTGRRGPHAVVLTVEAHPTVRTSGAAPGSRPAPGRSAVEGWTEAARSLLEELL